MKCSNCGAEIPYSGRVCPLCHVDKSEDKERHVRNHQEAAIGCLASVVGALLGYAILGCVGVFPGLVVGVLTGFLVGQEITKRRG